MLWWIVLLVLVAWWITSPLYWVQRRVPTIPPLPLFGNCLPLLYLSTVEFFQKFYSNFPNAPYIGIHFFTRPVLILKDPKVILEVLEEQSYNFSSHGMYINKLRDPMGRSLFHLDGAEWKETRSKLSPYFSLSKVKAMSEIGEASIERLINHIKMQSINMPEGGECEKGDVEVVSAAMMYSADLTAAALFGLHSNVFEEGKDSDFYTTTKDLNTPSSIITALISLTSPFLYDVLKLQSFTKKANNFITRVVEAAMKSRLEFPLSPPDFIQGMLQFIKNNPDYDEKFLVSQGAVLWVGGVETTASTLSFALYELAMNQSLQEELRPILGTNKGADLLKKIIAETLRKYPIFSFLTRCSTTPCRLSTGLELETGTLLIIPVFSLHRDPAHFEDPNSFCPHRQMTKGTYLPFGAGPRTCLGMRFAYANLEKALSRLIENFTFTPGTSCTKPLNLDRRTFFTAPEHGIWLNVKALK